MATLEQAHNRIINLFYSKQREGEISNKAGIHTHIGDDYVHITLSSMGVTQEGMQINFFDGYYEVSEYMAGPNEDKTYILSKNKTASGALNSLLKGNTVYTKRTILDILD